MTAEPFWPGDGPSLYQPGTDQLLGTCTVPFLLRPSSLNFSESPMIGIARWIGLDLDTSRLALVKGSDGRFELDGAPGEETSKITLDVAGEEENGDATTTRRGAWPDGDVRPMGPGILGPTRGPCRP